MVVVDRITVATTALEVLVMVLAAMAVAMEAVHPCMEAEATEATEARLLIRMADHPLTTDTGIMVDQIMVDMVVAVVIQDLTMVQD